MAAPWIASKRPDLVILSCGFDAHAADSLVPLRVSVEAFRACGLLLASLRVPILAVLEGGYAVPVLGPCVYAFIVPFLGVG